MTYRGLSAILFALIIATELFVYLSSSAPTKTVKGSLFITEVDSERLGEQTNKYIILIATSVLVGGIVTFALPNRSIK